MKTIILIRTSTISQKGAGQKQVCLKTAQEMGYTHPLVLTFAANANSKATKAAVTAAVSKAGKGGTIIISEISRLARTVTGILDALNQAAAANVKIIDAQRKSVIGEGLNDKVIATVMALVAEIEHTLIKERITDSMSAMKQAIKDKGFYITRAGRKLTKCGRPLGTSRPPKLMEHKEAILQMHNDGYGYAAIARIIKGDQRTVKKVVLLSQHRKETKQ